MKRMKKPANKKKARKKKRQVAALPFRISGNQREVLLITSRETRRWVIPKGWPMKGKKDWEAAATEAFEEAGALDQLEGFASFHGPDFYGLPRNTGRITLTRAPWTLPETLPFGDAQIKPLCGGETLAWRMQA